MFAFLSSELRQTMEQARLRQARKRARLRVQVGGAVFPVLRLWHDGLALDAALCPHLRGLVDVYDGANLLMHCLIVASRNENGEIVCEFKTSTLAADRPPLDFWRDENKPVALLPQA